MTISILNSLASAQAGAEPYSAPLGSIMRSINPIDGYLLCDGSEIFPYEHPQLAMLLGMKGFIVNHPAGLINGTPWVNQHYFNEAIQSSPFYMSRGEEDPMNNNYGNVVVTNNKVLLFGYISNEAAVSDKIWSSTIDTGGMIGSWSYATLPFAVAGSACVLAGDTIIVTGGFSNYSTQQPLSLIYTCKIGLDGTLGAWNVSALQLPAPLAWHSSVVHGSTLYVLGGLGNSQQASTAIYSIQLDDDNDLMGDWSTSQTVTPNIYYAGNEYVVVGDYLYAIGGQNLSGNVPYVYRSSLSGGDLSPFEQYCDLVFFNSADGAQVGVGSVKVVTTAAKMFVMLSGLGFQKSVCSLDISPSGELSNPTMMLDALVPSGISGAVVFATSSGVYAIGCGLNGASVSYRWRTPFTGGADEYTDMDFSDAYITAVLPDYSAQDALDGLSTYIKS